MEKIDFNEYPLSPEVLDQLQENIISEFKNQTKLWEGTLLMTDDDIINLSQKVSDQKNGIILSFCGYSNGQAQNNNWSQFVIPKKWLEGYSNGGGHFFLLGGASGPVAYKYIYIRDTQLQGHANNSGSHGDYNNSNMALRYVWGF